MDTVIDEFKVMAVQALDYDLIKAGEAMDEAVTGLRGLKQMADQSMLDRRKAAGVWTEKGRRSAGRGDLKMPTFSGSSSDRITVYEFEKEWTSYKSAVNFTVEEALKELKVAVQAPARQAVDKLGSELAIFKYLRTHFGNPVLLLSARETEATVTLCTDHNILKYLHFSSIAGIVQSKLPYDMVRD